MNFFCIVWWLNWTLKFSTAVATHDGLDDSLMAFREYIWELGKA